MVRGCLLMNYVIKIILNTLPYQVPTPVIADDCDSSVLVR